MFSIMSTEQNYLANTHKKLAANQNVEKSAIQHTQKNGSASGSKSGKQNWRLRQGVLEYAVCFKTGLYFGTGEGVMQSEEVEEMKQTAPALAFPKRGRLEIGRKYTLGGHRVFRHSHPF